MFTHFKPDTGNFNRLLVWLGLAFVVASLLVPWLFYRETGVLKLRQHELRGLTPVARGLLVQRQREVGRIQSHISWALTAAPAGLILVFWGAVGMYRQQRVEDDRLRAETKEAVRRAELEPQTGEEQEARLIVEQQESEAESVRLTPEEILADERAPEDPGGVVPRPTATESAPERAASIPAGRPTIEAMRRSEDEVISRLASLALSGLVFRAHVKVRTDERGASLLLDAVFEGRGGTPDVVVEIKQLTLRAASPRMYLRRYIDDTLARVVRYQAATGTPSIGWLIVRVSSEDTDLPALRREARHHTQGALGRIVAVDVIESPSELTELPPQALSPRSSLV